MRHALLALALLALSCNKSTHRPDGGDTGCVEGAHRCDGLVLNTCHDGQFVFEMSCPTDTACSDALGCVACAPGKYACDGDRVVACGVDGKPTKTLVEDCLPSTCAMVNGDAACIGPCDPRALAKSYTGCVYYAVDLPQFGLPGPGTTVASDQQFAVAVANPNPVAIDVVVDRDAAQLGMPASPSQVMKKQVPPGGLVVLPLPQREVSGFVLNKKRNGSLLSPNAYRITTSRPASVYQFNPANNPNAYSNDASLLIPVNALDESYVVLGWPGTGGDVDAFGLKVQTDKRSFITIVATKPDTKLRVTPSTEVIAGDNVPVMHKGKSYTFTLGEFEVLNLEGADFAVAGATDFSGTRIEADAPIAVWSGVECITINPMKPPDEGTCCCDHLEEQLFPRSSLGKDYVVVTSQPRGNLPDPEFFRILALEGGTEVKTSLPAPNNQFTLAAGAVREILVRGDDFTVTASKPVEIGQFQVSQDSSFGGNGDPSFELVPPIAQFRPAYIFLVPSGYMESYMLIAIPTGTPLMLDGKPDRDCDVSGAGTLNGKTYDALRCPVSAGTHTVSAAAPFGLIVEGWGPGPVSYGYTGGMQFEPVNNDCAQDGDCPNAEFCAGGACVPIIQ